tara:strand:+ start:367 stop:1092 length:726 start_codon:yes stop_codon:yes gene_type:complete
MIKKIIRRLLKRGSFVRGSINLNTRVGALHKAWGYIFSNHIFGDYVEFGVYQGDSFIASTEEYLKFKKWLDEQKNSNESWRQDVAKKSPLNEKVVFHGLDTFEGMPKNNEDEILFKEKSFLSNFDDVKKRIKYKEIDFRLYKGTFNKSENIFKKNIENKNISIANIDCDIYDSTIDAFKMIKNNLSIGSIIMLDDYNSFSANNLKGQRKALIEFQETSNLILEPFFTYMYVGQAFIVVGKK